MTSSSRTNPHYKGMTPLDVMLNGVIDLYQNKIDKCYTPAQIRFLELGRNRKIQRFVKDAALKDLLKRK